VKKEIEETLSSPDCKNGGVKVVSLESRIKRIEIRGARSQEALKSALTISNVGRGGEVGGEKVVKNCLEEMALGQQHQLGFDQVWHRNVLDPRLHAILENCREWHPSEYFQSKLDNLKSMCDGSKAADLDKFDRSPMEDADLCKLQRKSDLLHDIFDTLLSEHRDNLMLPAMVVAKPNNQSKGSLSGYSLLLPASWVQSVWVPLMRLGATGIGLREWKWYLQSCGHCVFPDSYPDLSGGLDVRHSLECATNASLPTTGDGNQLKGVNWVEAFCGTDDANGQKKKEQEEGEEEMFVARTKEVLETSIHCVNYARAPRKPTHRSTKWAPVKDVAPSQDPLCLVRALLAPVRKGTVESWSKIFKATQRDMDTFLASRNRKAFSNAQEEEEYGLDESRPLLGYVTLGVLPKKCKGFDTRAEMFCQAKTFWKATSEQQTMRNSFKDRVLVMLLCKDRSGNSGILRPAFATLADNL
jgi:hypothetical protein